TSMTPSRSPYAGTAGYRAPEAGSHQHSPGLDVYAVAVMIYQMLEAAMPFGEYRHPQQQPIQPAALNAAQWQVLQSGCAIQPDQRPASVRALLQTLQVAARPLANAAQSKAASYSKQQEIKESPIEAAARQRAEQRRQRKELEKQRREQASAALRALIARQNRLHAIEDAQRRQKDEQQRLHKEQQEQRRQQEEVMAAVSNNDTPGDVTISWEEAQRYLAAISRNTASDNGQIPGNAA
ncbi:MAG: hypothetical protein HYR68_11995, partial [Burkholderiales bacterium]|nr:hypothetical protein [Burkholderiales bacterium]